MIRAFTRHVRLTSYSFEGWEWHYLAGALAAVSIIAHVIWSSSL